MEKKILNNRVIYRPSKGKKLRFKGNSELLNEISLKEENDHRIEEVEAK